MRPWRIIGAPLLGLAALALSGCFYLSGHRILDPQFHDVTAADPQHPRIRGVARLMDDGSGRVVAVVFVHGGGFDPDPGYSARLRTALVKRLGVSTSPQCVEPHPLPSAPLASFAMCQYVGGGHRPLRFYELYWEPMWNRIWKANLDFDNANGLGRLSLNHYVKKQLLNDRYAEEVLYGGKFGRLLRAPVRELLCAVASDAYINVRLLRGGASDSRGPCAAAAAPPLAASPPKHIVVVGMSLGSVMLIDGITDAITDPQDRTVRRAAAAVMREMQALFMLSNQIPLSRLGDIAAVPSEDTPEPEPAVSPAFVEALQARCPQEARSEGCHPLEIVAITDPNDVVGYFIWQPQIPPGADRPYAVWTNVLVHNARWVVPWLLANPVDAHTAHDQNDDVIDVMACGVPARCGLAADGSR